MLHVTKGEEAGDPAAAVVAPRLLVRVQKGAGVGALIRRPDQAPSLAGPSRPKEEKWPESRWAPQSSPEGRRWLSTLDWSCPLWVPGFPRAEGHSERKRAPTRTQSHCVVDPVPAHLAGRGRGGCRCGHRHVHGYGDPGGRVTGSLWGGQMLVDPRGQAAWERKSHGCQ